MVISKQEIKAMERLILNTVVVYEKYTAQWSKSY